MGDLQIIYHGSYVAVPKPKIIQGRFRKDFGDGFYCTSIRNQAIRWANKYDTPVLSTYQFRPSAELDILVFNEMTDEWLDFIADCRAGKPHTHDIVIGAMADDQIYNYIADFIAGIITREQFWALAKYKYPTHQICLCTEKALKTLEFTLSESCNYED